MLKNIRLKNFRSVTDQSISLMPITVFIGANGSGKSNIVKALKYIGDIARDGCEVSTFRQGGPDSIIPKRIRRNEYKHTETTIEYEKRLLNPLPNDDLLFPEPLVRHRIDIKYRAAGDFYIKSEKLLFHDFLYLAAALDDYGTEDIDEVEKTVKGRIQNQPPSTFTVSQDSNGNESYKSDPPFSKRFLDEHISWLGFSSFKNEITSPASLKRILAEIGANRAVKSRKVSIAEKQQAKLRTNVSSLIDPSYKGVLDYCAEYQFFASRQRNLRRFELLLNELRDPQYVSQASDMSSTGGNLPGAIRWLQGIDDQRGYHSLQNTFREIAPHIEGITTQTLRGGKQFLEFLERQGGRGVESWETSDGSLRAIAILIAVESAPNGTTLIIEEPEQGLHPWAIRSLMDHVREKASEKELQVIFTTHSEQLLSAVHANEVRVCTRSKEGNTLVANASELVKEKSISKNSLGRLWVKGLLGGTPVDEDYP